MQEETLRGTACNRATLKAVPAGVDEWVSFEYGPVREFYDKMRLGDKTAIEFFLGPHEIHGKGAFEFLKKQLRWSG